MESGPEKFTAEDPSNHQGLFPVKATISAFPLLGRKSMEVRSELLTEANRNADPSQSGKGFLSRPVPHMKEVKKASTFSFPLKIP